MPDPIAVYVHSPFCPSKCGYCDFNSYAMSGDVMPRTARAIAAEIRDSPWRGTPSSTIFFGGGTPTHFATEDLLGIFEAVLEVHPPEDGCEITSEANPGTADAEKFRQMRAAGFNRLSIGAQSFVDSDLVMLERVHKSAEIERAVGMARAAGFENLNLDLMFALPHQSMAGWMQNLDRAFALRPEHLSLYCLTIEPETSFYRKQLRGQLTLPNDEMQVAMYEACLDRAAGEGFIQYEISNFARPGRECRHNLAYWNGSDYAGYGPGAVGCVGGVRYTNLKHPERYCAAVETDSSIPFEREQLSEAIRRTESIMLGMRLNQGILASELPSDAVRRLADRGWIWQENGRLGLTRAGRHFCTEAVLELI